MKSFPVRKIFTRSKAMVSVMASLTAAVALSSCGGGGSGSDDDGSAPTIRPKTMDGLILNLEAAARFEFIRSAGSSGAPQNGDVETGTYFYTSRIADNVLRTYDNIGGDKSNFRYPSSINAATYTYRAINDSSAVLTITGNGIFSPGYFIRPGEGALNNSFIQLLYTYSPGVPVADTETHVAEIALTFTSNGTFVTTDTVTLRLPESPLVSTFDTVRIPTNITLSPLGFVPVNYNPVVNPSRPSRIAPASLGKRLLAATNGVAGTSDPEKNFSIQFVADATTPGGGIPGGAAAETTEVGHGLLYVVDTAATPPGPVAVGIALDYTWRRISGTDSGELVLSNIPDNPLLPFDSTLNGKMTLLFTGKESGRYTGAADGDTIDAADVTGSFYMPDN